MGSKQRCSFNYWPETEEGRLQKVESITRVLSTAVFGILSQEEAHKNARVIERKCYAAADDLFMEDPHGDGRSALQLYETESCNMMWEVLRRHRKTTAEDETVTVDTPLNGALFDISCEKVTAIGAIGASSLFKPLAASGQSYKRFCFRNRSFGLEAANVAKPVLESIRTQITELDISGFVAGRPENEALDVMSIFSKALEGSVLRCLNISDISLGEKGVRAFRELLNSQEDLEELYFMNNGLVPAVARALSKLIPSTGKLKVLHVHNNFIGDDGAMSLAEIIKGSPNLVSFRCSAAGIGTNGIIALSEALVACIHLEKLDIRDNMYGADAVTALEENLGKLPELTDRLLSVSHYKDNKVKPALANVLKQSAPDSEAREMIGIGKASKAALPSTESEPRARLKELSMAEDELFARWGAKLGTQRKSSVDENKYKLGGFSITSNPGSVHLNAKDNFISEGIGGDCNLSFCSLDKNQPEDAGILHILDKNGPERKAEGADTPHILDKNEPEGKAEDEGMLGLLDKNEPGVKAQSEDDVDGGLGLKHQNLV